MISKHQLFIGLLSGTSLDAIDAAIISFANNKPKIIDQVNYTIPNEIKQKCLIITETGNCNIDELGTLDHMLGIAFANSVMALLKKSSLEANYITAIGCHGQTIRHMPNTHYPFTLQIGDPNIIAHKTGITTISDFRRRDIAAGGQGAPLAPAFHHYAFHSKTENRFVINIGGISNLSFIPKDSLGPTAGFDTGPGNCLLDYWAQTSFNVKFDQDGAIARNGHCLNNLLNKLLSDNYFSLPYPKSTGREYFNPQWLTEKLNLVSIGDYAPEDILTTLTHLTAKSIVTAIEQIDSSASVYICGGGAENIFLINIINQYLNKEIKTTTTLGMHPQWVETALFAWLAKQTIEGKSANHPKTTGAKQSVILGCIYAV